MATERNHGMAPQDYNIGSDGLEFFTCYTLVDITKTGIVSIYKPSPIFLDDVGNLIVDQQTWNDSRNQQRNWETAVQIISLRAQPMFLEESKMIKDVDFTTTKFGTEYTGTAHVWSFNFGFENQGIPVESLKQDIDSIPIIIGLNEMVDFPAKTFITSSKYANVYFESSKNFGYNYV